MLIRLPEILPIPGKRASPSPASEAGRCAAPRSRLFQVRIRPDTTRRLPHRIFDVLSCTEEGTVEYWHCSACDKNYDKEVDGKVIEGSFRAHQVPISMEKEEHLKLLENWLRSYKPEKWFDSEGHLIKELKDFCPKGEKRMGSSLYTNGGYLRKDLINEQ